MNYFDPTGDSTSIFDVCHAYQLLEANYNVGGWLRERPSNRRRIESIGCQLARIGYSDVYRDVDLWADAETVEEEKQSSDDDENVRFVYFKKALEWGLPLDEDDRAVIDRIFTIDAIEGWRPDYFPVRPWRVDLRPDHELFDTRPAWMLTRPMPNGISIYHCDEEGQPTYFHSYSDATQKAKSLTEELHASNQGTDAQSAYRPGA